MTKNKSLGNFCLKKIEIFENMEIFRQFAWKNRILSEIFLEKSKFV